VGGAEREQAGGLALGVHPALTAAYPARMLTVRCDCGWSFEGEEDDLVEAVIAHGRETHGMEVSREQALAMAEPA